MNQDEREKHIHQIRICEQLECWDQMWVYIEQLAPNLGDTEEERSFATLAVNCINKRVGNLRTACQRVEQKVDIHLKESQHRPNFTLNDEAMNVGHEYKAHMLKQLRSAIEESIKLIHSTDGQVQGDEAKTLFARVVGDCHRYLADVVPQEEHSKHVSDAESAYGNAKSAASQLPADHLVRLQTMNNYAIFLFEHKGDVEGAFTICEEAYLAAKESVRSNSDAMVPLQMLHDNMICWQHGLEHPRFTVH